MGMNEGVAEPEKVSTHLDVHASEKSCECLLHQQTWSSKLETCSKQ